MRIDNRIHVDISGNPNGLPLILHHALGACGDMWRPQLPILEPRFRVIRMDMRGHGKSLAPAPPYSMEDLADDVVLVMDELGLKSVRYMGLSIGGMIGQALALKYPQRLDRMVISNTTSRIPADLHPLWDQRIKDVREGGMQTQVAMTLQRWFTEDYATGHQDVLDWITGMVRKTDPDGFIGCCAAIRGLDLTAKLAEIKIPVLIIAGGKDPGIPPEWSEDIHAEIHGSELMIIEDAAHLANVQAEEEFNTVIGPFLKA